MPLAECIAVRTISCPTCCLCSTRGEVLHKGLKDHLFGTPGVWNFRKCLNQKCQMVWLDPMPCAEDIPKLYMEYYTHTIDTHPKWVVKLHDGIRCRILAARFGYKNMAKKKRRNILGEVLSCFRDLRDRMGGEVMWLEASRRGRLLDVGCGNGEFMAFMRDLGWQVTGVEPDLAAVRAAKDLFGLEVLHGYLEDTNLPQTSFDAITMNHIIEHVPDPNETLRECFRLLKEEGQLIMVTPNTYSLGHVNFAMDWRGLEPPRHLHLYNPQCIRTAVTRAGLAIKSVRTTAKGAVYFLMMSRMSRKTRLSGANSNHSKTLGQARKQLFMCVFNQIWESVVLSLNRMRGEEIIVVAEKPL